ncbi:hypothetical protein VZT92_000197 [Zoarces viviparus]|uniref:Uncharacterized protein n=1 Tax=Zoarces viviparus TaxID=48416 RepID=A0AAW1G676_ZOAVI
MKDLKTDNMNFQKTIKEQASEIVALKERMAAKELFWDHEKQKIIRVLYERQTAEIAVMKKQMADKELTWEQEKQKIINTLKSEREHSKIEKVVTEKKKDKIILSLRQSLLEKQNESAEFNRVVKSLKGENETFRKKVMDMDAKLGTQQQNVLRQTILDLESYARQKDSELIRSEAEWNIKLTALEDRMRSELAAKEESFQGEQELQRQSREMEEEWRNQKEEEIKPLTQQNADLQEHNLSLQELAQETDKEKAQFKEEENKLTQTILHPESYARQKDSELIRSEVEWNIKLTALEDRVRSELAAKEESFQRGQELQRQSREMEEEWRNQKEEEIKLLAQQNADLQEHNLSLQELAQETDKEKAQFKEEENKLTQTILHPESYARQKDSELIQSEAEWNIKLTALEDRMRSELAAKEESFQGEQELQRQSREMEEEWRNQKEEEIKLLTQQNADLQEHNLSLQELAQETDKEKAHFREKNKLRQTILCLESYARQKDSELIWSEAEWNIKLTALEDRMRSELAAKEESFQREQELQSREMEEEWRNQKEEAIKLLTQQNADLQEHNLRLHVLAQQTDK